MQMAPGWASSPAAEGGAPLRGILGGWRTELTRAASVFQLPKKPHTQRQSNPLLQNRLGLTRETTAGTKELDVPTETLSSSQQWAPALRKAKQVLSCVSKSAASTPGKGIFPLLNTSEAAPGELWSDLGSQVQHESHTDMVEGLEQVIYMENLREPGLSTWS